MESVEDAYTCIGKNLIAKLNKSWAHAVFKTKILSDNCSSMTSLELDAEGKEHSFGLGNPGVFEVNDACLFLRDNLLATTGERIWGLTFTLYPDGKFKIEYDYNKPEGYEETDEVISVDEALSGLNVTPKLNR